MPAKLLDAGADPTLKSNDGETPLALAIGMDRPAAIITVLEAAAQR